MVQQNHCPTQIDYPVKSQKPQCHDLKQFHVSSKSNQLSHWSRARFSESESSALLSPVTVVLELEVAFLFESFLFLYFFLGFCCTRRVLVEESFHHKSMAVSAEKLLKGGPSVFISNKSLKVSELRLVLFSF